MPVTAVVRAPKIPITFLQNGGATVRMVGTRFRQKLSQAPCQGNRLLKSDIYLKLALIPPVRTSANLPGAGSFCRAA